jgi:hypothetical protein
VASALKLHRNGAVGFIDWLDDLLMTDRTNNEQQTEQNEPADLVYEHETAEASDLLVLELHILSPLEKACHCDTVGDAVIENERWLAEGDPSLLVPCAQQSQKVAAHDEPRDRVNRDDAEQNCRCAHHLTRKR